MTEGQPTSPLAVPFLSVPLLAITTRDFIEWVCNLAATSELASPPRVITYLNAWCSNVASRDREYLHLLQQADGVYADGQAIVWASRFLNAPVPERVNAADFIVEFFSECARRGLSIYLLGSEPGVAAAAAAEFKRQVPNLKIVGTHHGYVREHQQQILSDIDCARPDILLVGMGVPLQEKWVWENRAALKTRVVWCIGAMFEYHSRTRARAPVWVRKAGLEWAFRLVLEPRRLWRRYILGNTEFILRVVRAKLKG